MKNIKAIDEKIKGVEKELAVIEAKRAELKKKIADLESRKFSLAGARVHTAQVLDVKVTNGSSEEEKIALFRSLFRGREDVFARRFESAKSGKNGYQPIHEIYAALISDEIRNRLIIKDVLDSVASHRFPVILTERKEHLDNLYKLLADKITNVIVMKGGMGKKQRSDVLEKLSNLPDEEEKVIIATGRYLDPTFRDVRCPLWDINTHQGFPLPLTFCLTFTPQYLLIFGTHT